MRELTEKMIFKVLFHVKTLDFMFSYYRQSGSPFDSLGIYSVDSQEVLFNSLGVYRNRIFADKEQNHIKIYYFKSVS